MHELATPSDARRVGLRQRRRRRRRRLGREQNRTAVSRPR